MSVTAKAISALAHGVDPAAPLDDLDAFGSAVGSARVVGIGEAIHGVADFYRLKHRLFRYLVERHGFRVFALESGFVEGLVVDAWIRGDSEASLDEVLRTGFTYNMGCCEEFAAQLEWMREWNRQRPDDPVNYVGSDLPAWLGSMAPAVDHVVAFLGSAAPRGRDDLIEVLGELVPRVSGRFAPDAVAGYATLSGAERHALTAALDDLVTELSLHLPAYGDRAAARIAVRCAEIAVGFDRWLRVAASEPPESLLVGAPRDLVMAQTVVWATARDRRVVYGAHNGHVQCTPMRAGLGWSAGGYLRALLGGDYLAVATAYGRSSDPNWSEPTEDDATIADLTEGTACGYGPAPDGTVDALLTREHAVGLIDLRSIQASEVPARIRMQGAAVPVDLAVAFDVVIGVGSVGPMTPRATDREDG